MTAGVVGSICLLLGRIVGENMEKAVMGIFWLMRPLLNGYGEKVNGSLIHANRLAFGRVWNYLCIVAAPCLLMCQSSLHGRWGVASKQNVKYNAKKY